jgi:hypothetical protein
MIFAQLLLKVGEETPAFPHIEELAATHPRPAKDLADEFLRVWTKNHNLNTDQNRAGTRTSTSTGSRSARTASR